MVSRRFLTLWRGRLRPYWRDVRPIVVAGAGLAVIVLGTIGYLQYSDENNLEFDFFDAFYRAIGLFGLTGGVDHEPPLTLQIARFLGPLVFGYAALQALLALFRHEARLLWIRGFTRNHVVIAGLGEKGFRLATAIHAQGRAVIVIDRDEANPRRPGMRERGITVLNGDATDAEVLRRAQAGKAKELVAVCGSDGTNVDVAVGAEGLALQRSSGVLTALVHLDDEDLWWTLTTAAVGSDEPKFRLEFFNVADRAARAMVVEHPPFPPAGERSLHHVLLVGLHGVGRPLVLRIAGAFRAASDRGGERLRITMAGVNAADDVEDLRRRHPEIDEICALHAVEDFEEVEELATASYVCASDEAKALSTALALRAGAGRLAPVVIAVADEESGVARALRAEGRALEGIEPFGVLSHALTTDLVEYAETEMLARLKHEEYREAEARRGKTNPPLPDKSLLPWEELPDPLKESNRRFADGISKKLQDSSCILVPAPLVDPKDPGFAFTDAEVEPLAIKEHDRWMADLQRDGWRYAAGTKDPDKKLHPLLVPWEQLSEENKDRDRDPVREVPRMLAVLGFRVIRLEPDEPVPVPAALSESAPPP